MTIPTMAGLLTTVLNSLDDRSLSALLGSSMEIWLTNNVQAKPIVGAVLLWVLDQPIDCQAAVGKICQISRGGVTNDVKDFAKSLGLFGIFAGWGRDSGETYVESVN